MWVFFSISAVFLLACFFLLKAERTNSAQQRQRTSCFFLRWLLFANSSNTCRIPRTANKWSSTDEKELRLEKKENGNEETKKRPPALGRKKTSTAVTRRRETWVKGERGLAEWRERKMREEWRKIRWRRTKELMGVKPAFMGWNHLWKRQSQWEKTWKHFDHFRGDRIAHWSRWVVSFSVFLVLSLAISNPLKERRNFCDSSQHLIDNQ